MYVIVLCIVQLSIGISLFILGINWLQVGLSHTAIKYNDIKQSSNSKNNLKNHDTLYHNTQGVLLGTLSAGIAHSSGAITVLAITLSEASLISLPYAISLVLGANIGTTITGLITGLSSFKIGVYFGLLLPLGMIIRAINRLPKTNHSTVNASTKTTNNTSSRTIKKSQLWSNLMIGLGLIFIGLSLASDSFNSSEITLFLEQFFIKVSFAPLLIIFAALFSAIIQSSSLTTALAIMLVANNTIPLSSALYIVLGADCGTCIIAWIASIGKSKNALTIAKFQLWFNIICTTCFGILLILTHDLIPNLLLTLAPPPLAVAIFHLSFNTIGVLIALPFLNQILHRPILKLA